MFGAIVLALAALSLVPSSAAQPAPGAQLPGCDELRLELTRTARQRHRAASKALASGDRAAAAASFAAQVAELESCEPVCERAADRPAADTEREVTHALLFEQVTTANAFYAGSVRFRRDALTRLYALSLFQLGRLLAGHRDDRFWREPERAFCKAIQARPDLILRRASALSGRAKRAFREAKQVCHDPTGFTRRPVEYVGAVGALGVECAGPLFNRPLYRLWSNLTAP